MQKEKNSTILNLSRLIDGEKLLDDAVTINIVKKLPS